MMKQGGWKIKYSYILFGIIFHKHVCWENNKRPYKLSIDNQSSSSEVSSPKELQTAKEKLWYTREGSAIFSYGVVCEWCVI